MKRSSAASRAVAPAEPVPPRPSAAVDAMGRVHYSGVRAVGFLVYLLLVGLNLSAVGFLFRKLGSLVGLCAAPTHTEFIERLMSCIRPVIGARGVAPRPVDEDGKLRGCVVLCNHVNWSDFVLDIAFVPDGVYVSRNVLKLVFFPGSLIRSWLFGDMIYFSRGKKDAKRPLYDAVAAKCAEGRSVIVYAEGTRNPTGEKMPLRVGLIKLAYDRGIPLYVSMVSNKYAIVDEKAFKVTLGETIENKMSKLVRPEDFADLQAFLAAAQAEWDAVWAALHK